MPIQKQGAGADRVSKKTEREQPAREPQEQENRAPKQIDQDEKDLGETNEVQPNPNEGSPDFIKTYEELIAQGEIAPVFGQPDPARPPLKVSDAADIEQLVADAVAKLLARGVGNIPAQPVQPPAPQVPEYKKHYRNDLRPDEIIQRLDMSALDRGERPQANPIPGSYIKFRLGHLYTNDDNDIRQIEWMASRQATDAEGGTIGGAPHIYEDDGSVLLHCARCEKTFASKAAYDAHMRGVHGVI